MNLRAPYGAEGPRSTTTAPQADAQAALVLAVSPAQAAAALGIARSTVYDLLRAGDIPSFRVGVSRRIRVADLEGFIDRQTKTERASSRGDAA